MSFEFITEPQLALFILTVVDGKPIQRARLSVGPFDDGPIKTFVGELQDVISDADILCGPFELSTYLNPRELMRRYALGPFAAGIRLFLPPIIAVD
jgi:hypothetical protein